MKLLHLQGVSVSLDAYTHEMRGWSLSRHIKHRLEVVYMPERIHQALDCLTLVEFEMAARANARYPLLSPA